MTRIPPPVLPVPSTELLRQYAEWECELDGYPPPWNKPSVVTPNGTVLCGILRAMAREVVESRPAIKDLIREQADHRCLRCGHPYRAGDPAISERGEWSPCDPFCHHPGPVRWVEGEYPEGGLPHGEVPEPYVQAHWRILTVHHLDSDKANCRWWNLASLCQRCHLRMQRAVIMGRPYHYEHSTWFKPFAAGFYAWKYLGEDLSREEVSDRLDDLLALEHRFTQERLT